MTAQNIKNLLAAIGFVATILGISTIPYMVKWYCGLYVVFLIALWLGDEGHE